MERIGFRKVAPLAGAILLLSATAWAQSLPNAGVLFGQNIQIPGWGTTGSKGNANVDLMGFNPVTRTMYLSDKTNGKIDVIDTHDNSIIGQVPIPPTSVYTAPPTGPNGVVVAVNLQQLAVTDGLQSVYVWNLLAPQAQPDVYTLPASMGTDTDAIDYDPVNQTLYVVTDNPPEYLVGINLAYKKIVAQIPLPVSSDLIKWNSIDGKVYISAEDADGTDNNAAAGIYSYDPASGPSGKVSLVTRIGPACPGHGIDIDPISDIAVMGCFGGTSDTGDVVVNLSTGTPLPTLTDVGGTDAVVYNPNLRRFYISGALGTATTSGCPKNSTGSATPIMGIASGATGKLDGTACIGGGHIVGVDPISNQVYVPVSQYPADPTSATSGVNGVLVFQDTTAPAQAPVTTAQATLAGTGASAATGTVQMSVLGRHMHATASPAGLPSGSLAAWLTVPTTVADEWLPCAVNQSTLTAICSEDMLGDPLIGATITFSVDMGQGGVAAGRGIVSGH